MPGRFKGDRGSLCGWSPLWAGPAPADQLPQTDVWKDAHRNSRPCFSPGSGPGNGVGQEWVRAECAARPSPQAILPLMKFLEVELCYMNTNLVQENFSRSAVAACPAALIPSSTPPPAPPSLPFSGEDATILCLNAPSQGLGAHFLTLG